MTTEQLKPFSVRVTIMGHSVTDVLERMQDSGENPIDSFIPESIEEVSK